MIFLCSLLFALAIGVFSYFVCNIELLVIQSVNTCKKSATTTNEVMGTVWSSMLVLNKVGSAETENSQMATQLQKLQDKSLHHHEDSIFNSPGPATWWASVVIC
jgi:hypothetical protein